MEYRIDLSKISTKKEFHDKIEEVLPCPDYYGRNLDALYDILTESAQERKLIFCGCAVFRERMPGYMAALEELCMEAAEEQPGLVTAFRED